MNKEIIKAIDKVLCELSLSIAPERLLLVETEIDILRKHAKELKIKELQYPESDGFDSHWDGRFVE